MVSFIEVKNIFDTLPIGYYLGRRIEYILSESCKSSYFDPAKDLIIVSYPMISEATKSFKDTDNLESVIRGLLYHEIAHVMLTPPKLKKYAKSSKYADAINIVEDERIETLCKNTFMNVNFKRNIILINNYKGEEPKTADSAFYHLVRYHKGETRWLSRLEFLLSRYSHIIATSEGSYYAHDIEDFYKDFIKDYKSKESSSHDTSKSSESKYNSSDIDNSSIVAKNSNNDINNENELNIDNVTIINEDENEDESKDEVDSILDSIEDFDDIKNITKDAFKNIASSTIDVYYDAQLEERLNKIILDKLKKKAINGSAISSYSGRLNIRAIGTRDDYRWWSQQNRAGHVKQCSKVHFTLYIDNSGSFYKNDDKMNTFIRTLDRINDPDFSFDVVTINTHVVEWPDHNCIFNSDGGNKLNNDIANIIKKHHKPNCNNYDIVLFDGDAHSDDYSHQTPEPFSKFDSINTIIISDSYNKRYIEGSVKKAKVKYVNDYCKVFINSICDLLERAL